MPLLPSALIDSLAPTVAYIQNDSERFGLVIQYLSSTVQQADRPDTSTDDPVFFSFDSGADSYGVSDAEYASDDTEIDDANEAEAASETDANEADPDDSWEGIPDSPSPVRRKRPRPVITDSEEEDSDDIPDFESFDVVPSGALPGVNSRGGKYLSKQVSKGLWINGKISINGIVARTKDRSTGRCDRCVRANEDKCVVLRNIGGESLLFTSASCGGCIRAGQSCKDAKCK